MINIMTNRVNNKLIITNNKQYISEIYTNLPYIQTTLYTNA